MKSIEYKNTNKGYIITFTKGSITIGYLNGLEIVTWIQDEWEEDASIVPAIANAIRITCEEGPETIAKMIALPSDRRRLISK